MRIIPKGKNEVSIYMRNYLLRLLNEGEEAYIAFGKGEYIHMSAILGFYEKLIEEGGK